MKTTKMKFVPTSKISRIYIISGFEEWQDKHLSTATGEILP